MLSTRRLCSSVFALVLALMCAFPASAQLTPPQSPRVAVDLAGGAGTAGLGGRIGLGASRGRYAAQFYMAGTLDGLVLAEGDSARSAWVNGFMGKMELGDAAGPVTGTVGFGFAIGSKNQYVPITDPETLERRRMRGESTLANAGFNEFYAPVELGATYWLGKSVGINAGGYVGIPIAAKPYTRFDTDTEVNAWQWATFVGVRIGRPAY